MKSNDKIYVAEYLNFLNESANQACTYHHIKKDSYRPITCKELAEKVNVTPATITNLNTNSKFYLLFRIAEEILDAYYGYFMYDEKKAKEEYPDEIIYPRDKNYVLMNLTSYYTNEWINGQI